MIDTGLIAIARVRVGRVRVGQSCMQIRSRIYWSFFGTLCFIVNFGAVFSAWFF